MVVLQRGKENFLVSFLVDARGGHVNSQRSSCLRICVPPGAASGPTRIICRLLQPELATVPPLLNDGETLASRILEMGPAGHSFGRPVLLEVPCVVSLHGDQREIIVLRSETGEFWKEETGRGATNEQELITAMEEELGWAAAERNSANRIHLHRIVTESLPRYYALVSRVRRYQGSIGTDGGTLRSALSHSVLQTIFPPGALQKRISVGLQAQHVPEDVIRHHLGPHATSSPILTIEPRRRKFHQPIEITIDMPASRLDHGGSNLHIFVSMSGGTEPAQWQDITDSIQLVRVENGVSFATTVSARIWLIDCAPTDKLQEKIGKIYEEVIAARYRAHFLIYAHTRPSKGVRVKCVLATEDRHNDEESEESDDFTLIGRSSIVEVPTNNPLWIEATGNLTLVNSKSDNHPCITFRPFHEARISLDLQAQDNRKPPLGAVTFLHQIRTDSPAELLGSVQLDLSDTLHWHAAPEEVVVSTRVAEDVADPPLFKPETEQRANDQELTIPVVKVERPESSESESEAVTPASDPQLARSELDLHEIASCLGADWLRLAGVLHLNEVDIASLQSQVPGINQQAFLALKIWQETSGPLATGNALANALQKIGRQDAVKSCMHDVTLLPVCDTNDDDDDDAEDQLILVGKEEGSSTPRSFEESLVVHTGTEGELEARMIGLSDDGEEEEEERDMIYMENVDEEEILPDFNAPIVGSAAPVGMIVEEDETAATDVWHRQHDDLQPASFTLVGEQLGLIMSNDSIDQLQPAKCADTDSDDKFERVFEEALRDTGFPILSSPGAPLTPQDGEGNHSLQHHHHHSVTEVHEEIRSPQQEKTEVEETVEEIENGVSLKRKIMRTEISQMVTVKESRKFFVPETENCTPQVTEDAPEETTEVEEVEEQLPDGTLVKRILTTKKVTQRIIERTVVEESSSDDQHTSSSSSDEEEEKEAATSDGAEETVTLPDGTVVTRRVVVKRRHCHDDHKEGGEQGQADHSLES